MLRAVVVLVVLALAAAVTILVGFDAAALLSPTFAALARVIRFGGDICGSIMGSVCCMRIDVEMLESVVVAQVPEDWNESRTIPHKVQPGGLVNQR